MTSCTQNISFSGNDNENTREVLSDDVVIMTSAGKHDHGSSKVKLRNIVDFNWENRLYSGQLLAVHIGGKFMAYGLRVPNNNMGTKGGTNGMVRVSHTLSDSRALLKGMCGQVLDLAFAHIKTQVILASIDMEGTIFIHEIELLDDKIKHELLLQVTDNNGGPGSEYRVVWCPYLPDEDDDVDDIPSEDSKLLVTTQGNKASIWNVSKLTERYGVGPHNASDLSDLTLTTAEHAGPVLDCAFSPDGTALATVSQDGYIMFFQVYLHNDNSPRCLHRWQPHDGKPLSCLLFLDNHKTYNPDEQFWKYAVTGALNNTELKLWTCKSWTCLQTITFAPSPNGEMTANLKAGLDFTANYLVLSDVKRRALYVLRMARDGNDNHAYCKTVSEFLLPYPALSFGIIDAGLQAFKCPSSCADPYHRAMLLHDPDSIDRDHVNDENDGDGVPLNGQIENGNDIESCNIKTVIRMFFVQPKSLQEGKITFDTPHLSDLRPFDKPAIIDSNNISNDISRDLDEDEVMSDTGKTLKNNSIISDNKSEPDNILAQQTHQLKNILLRSQAQSNNTSNTRSDSPPQQQQITLMTPDAFSITFTGGSSKNEDDDPPLTRSADCTPQPPAPEATAVPEPDEPDEEEEEMATIHLPMPDLPLPIVSDGEPPKTFAGMPPFGDALATKQLNKSAPETAWPPINMAKINEANQRKASSDKALNQSRNNSFNVSSELESTIVEPQNARQPIVNDLLHHSTPTVLNLSQDDKTSIKMLNLKLGRLFDLISEQKDEITALRTEVADLHQAQSAMAAKYVTVTENTIEEVLQKQSESFQSFIKDGIATRWEDMCSRAATSASKLAGACITTTLDPLVQSLQCELFSSLSTTDSLLRENIQKLVTSKSVTDSLGAAVTQNLQTLVKDSFRESIQTTLIPSMEKTQSQIFKQVNHSFQNGLKEFITATELAAKTAVERGTQPVSKQLLQALDQHTQTIKRIPAVPSSPPALPAGAITQVIKNVMEQEFTKWNDKASSMSESSRTPRPSSPNTAQRIDPQYQQNHIAELLSTGNINSAFQFALSASDLRLVMYACKMADTNRVFSPCQLQQHVLLSLIQQLSADMTADTALKYKYLVEAVMNLDTKNTITREHLPAVTHELQNQLSAFMEANPTHPRIKELKMLLYLTAGLTKA